MIWYKFAGAYRWVRCRASKGRRVELAEAQRRLDSGCRNCPSAQVHEAFGAYWLSCGDPGVDNRANPLVPTCGCVMAYIPRAKVAALRIRGVDLEAKGAARAEMEVAGKTMCVAECDQRKW